MAIVVKYLSTPLIANKITHLPFIVITTMLVRVNTKFAAFNSMPEILLDDLEKRPWNECLRLQTSYVRERIKQCKLPSIF